MSEVKCSVQNKIPAADDLHVHPPNQKLRPETELFPPADTEGRERAVASVALETAALVTRNSL